MNERCLELTQGLKQDGCVNTSDFDSSRVDKVGVLTITHTCNYGAELQAYALCKTIEGFGYPCELIDYSCPAVIKRETPHLPSLRSIRHPKSYLSAWLFLHARKQKYEVFKTFDSEMMPYGPKMADISEIAARYGTVVVGSDQTWNGPITGWDRTFLLHAPACEGMHKLAYAASFGDMEIGEQERELYRRSLSKFDALSTREASGVASIEGLGIQGACNVLDPTLLLSTEEWRSIAAAPPVEGPYVLAYLVGELEQSLKTAKQVATKLGLPLVVTNFWNVRFQSGFTTLNTITPPEFLGLIANAEVVITSSFHGTCFSILFEKNFRCVLREGIERNVSRIGELLAALGLENACIEAETGENYLEPLDYEHPRHRLQLLRNTSRVFLKTALTDATNVLVNVEDTKGALS